MKLENCTPRWRIAPQSAFRTETLTVTLTFNLLQVTIMTHTHAAKGQGQRSVGSIDTVETNE